MTGSPNARSRRLVPILFAVSAVALLAAAALTLFAISSHDTPESCCAGPVAAPGELPSPSPRPPATRAVGPPACVVGSWRTVDEHLMVRFYPDVAPLPFTAHGRYYEFRADGTGIERSDNLTMAGTYQGNRLRLVANGWREFTWRGTGTTITYVAITRARLTWSYYDQRGPIGTLTEKVDAGHNETNNYSCAGPRMTESNADGLHSEWSRTADYGAYG